MQTNNIKQKDFLLFIFYQTGTLHEVYTMLDGEETAALVKLRDGLDRLHQSKIIH